MLKQGGRTMLFEISIIPLGTETALSTRLAEILKKVDASGLPYQLTASATLIEGSWDQVMPVVRQCHEVACSFSPHVVTSIKIEDDKDAVNKLETNVEHVEEKLGRSLRKPERSPELVTANH